MTPKPVVPDFKPQRDGLKQVLGDLEADIMEYVWIKGHCTVRDVHEHLLKGRDLAYTTVMTVMGRLFEKEILLREAEGNTHLYRPAMTREEYISRVVGEVLDALLNTHSEQTISHLATRLGEADASKLSKLEQVIRQKRGR